MDSLKKAACYEGETGLEVKAACMALTPTLKVKRNF
jgi:hypothetical protein